MRKSIRWVTIEGKRVPIRVLEESPKRTPGWLSVMDLNTFDDLTRVMVSTTLQWARDELGVVVDEKSQFRILGSWETKRRHGQRPNDFDLELRVADVKPYEGKSMLGRDVLGYKIDLVLSDGKRRLVSMQSTPQMVRMTPIRRAQTSSKGW